MGSYFEDVGNFHKGFGLPTHETIGPRPLAPDALVFRSCFLLEELAEFFQATGMPEQAGTLRNMIAALKNYKGFTPLGWPGPCDIESAADALADLVYVACGTAQMMGIPFDEIWAEVQRANMTKVRASSADDPRSKRGHALDVVKPKGWMPPYHRPAIARAQGRHLTGLSADRPSDQDVE